MRSSGAELWAVIRTDLARYGDADTTTAALKTLVVRATSHPALVGVVHYRIGRWLHLDRSPMARVGLVIHRLLWPLVRMYAGVELPIRADIGPGLCVLHFGPTVLHPDTRAGSHFTLLQGVTIGEAKTGVPTFGDDVAIGTNATVIGGVVVGDRVHIGAGAVVTSDIPSDCTAVGIPARPLGQPAG